MLRAGFEVDSGLVAAGSCGVEGGVVVGGVAGCVIAVVVMLRCGDVVDLIAEDWSDDSA